MTAIRPPGVDVETTTTSASVSVVSPTLLACIIGPCFRVIDAFDDEGDAQDDAYAGTYQDGYGTVAYDLPSFESTDVLTGYTDEIRVFLGLGSDYTELYGESDEEVIEAGADGAYDGATGWTSATALFEQEGAEAGDYLRVTYLGRTLDIAITEVTNDTTLVIDGDPLPEAALVGQTYQVIRNPAQFVYQETAQEAWVTVGLAANYLVVTAQTDGDYAGDAGDQLTLSIRETSVYDSGADGAVGDSIFDSGSASFLTSLGAAGALADHYIVVGDYEVDDNGLSLLAAEYVVDDNRLLIETGSGELSGQKYVVGASLASGADGVYDHADDGHGDGDFLFTGIGVGTGGAGDLVEITGSGVYEITAIVSDDSVTLGTNHPSGDIAGPVAWRLIDNEAVDVDGATNADTEFCAPGGALDEVPAPVTNYSIVIGGSNYEIAAVGAADRCTLSSSAADGKDFAYEAVITTSDLSLEWDADALTIYCTLERASGVSSSTYAEIQAAITGDDFPLVSAVVTAALGGSTGDGNVDVTAAASYTFDGGADAGQLLLDEDLIGSEVPTGRIYVSWKGLRTDVTASADEADIITVDEEDDITTELGAASVDNPLALGVYFAKQACPTKSVKAIGVAAVSDVQPGGTTAAYLAAFSFLQGYDVYGLVPLTQDPVIHQLLDTHVTSMSASDQSMRRIGLINQALPDYAAATLVASGTSGNTGADFGDPGEDAGEFTSSTNFLEAGVVAGDVLVVGALAAYDESPIAAYGTQGPLYGLSIAEVDTDPFTLIVDTSDDGVNAGLHEDPVVSAGEWDSLVDVAFSVYRPGASITDNDDQAEALAQVGANYANRRMYFIWPDDVSAVVDGTEQWIPGYYLACGVAGWISENRPQKGLSKDTIPGFTGLRHSLGYFSNDQLNEIAGGGTMIFWQPSSGAALKCRHQLSTDTSQIEYRELSVVKAVDYVAKYFKQALDIKTGTFNITQAFLDTLSTAIQGILAHLVDDKVIISGELISIEVDDTETDQINVTVAIDVAKPCNRILLTIEY